MWHGAGRDAWEGKGKAGKAQPQLLTPLFQVTPPVYPPPPPPPPSPRGEEGGRREPHDCHVIVTSFFTTGGACPALPAQFPGGEEEDLEWIPLEARAKWQRQNSCMPPQSGTLM